MVEEGTSIRSVGRGLTHRKLYEPKALKTIFILFYKSWHGKSR